MPVDFAPVDEEWPLASTGHLLLGTPPAGQPTPIVAFRQEPVEVAYQDVLDMASRICYAFSLVWRDQFTFQDSAFCMANQLEPWLCYERRTNRWPGTELWDTLASVRWYRLTCESLKSLQQLPGLYRWLSPHYPEDLAFYGNNGRAWLGSISHEQCGWFDRSRMDGSLARSFVKRLRRHGVIDLHSTSESCSHESPANG